MQAVILVAAYGFIYHQVFSEHGNNQLNGLLQEFITLGNEKILAAIIFGLMFLNWGTEAAKWKYIIARIEKVSFFQAFKAILTGITISTFTPNRVGEYFGRAFILKKAHPLDAIILTIVGSMSQLLVTVIAG
ncbi:MAG: lysylphosphatidylglycerol synthase domain-containing protein, partial [Bacteroidales bacterium]